MNKIILMISTILLLSCNEAPWNKDAAKKWCMQDSKKYIDNGTATIEFTEKFCNCYADKIATNYKTVKEADKDKYTQMLVGKDCVEELKKTK